MSETYYLFKSDLPKKRWVMVMPKYKHLHHFGSQLRNYVEMFDKNSKHYIPDHKERFKIRNAYLRRHARHPKGRHSPSIMSDLINWDAPTYEQGIKAYENKFNVKVIFKNRKITEADKKKLLG